ncbi:MAG: FtsQ-type POTRA domain-containing protein [Intestinimonas sp.]|jgi:cell division protein FtsQ|nr:FtsQ-type POTRA domain-containing protein [Intestinimonas sp.]
MAAKRNSKRGRRNRGRFGGLYKIMSVILILAALVAGSAVFFRVDDVEVTGQNRYTADQIIQAAGVKQGDNLFLMNKFNVAKHLLSALPYIDEVNIRRALPDTLRITVTECVPAAVVPGEQNTWWIIDTKGKVLEQTDTDTADGTAKVNGLTAILPAPGTKLAVGDENSGKLQSLLDLMSAFAQYNMIGQVSAIDMTGDANIVFGYQGRFEVKIPMTCDFSQKVWALDAMVAQLQENESGGIDLTGDEKLYFNPNQTMEIFS